MINTVEYLGILVQGGLVTFLLLIAVFFSVIVPRIVPQRSESAKSLLTAVSNVAVINAIGYILWLIPELSQSQCGYYSISDVSPTYRILLHYVDLAILPITLFLGYAVTTGKKIRFKQILYVIVPLILFSIISLTTDLDYVFGIAHLLTLFVCIAQFVWYWRYIHIYQQKLLDTCSNIDGRSMKWYLWIQLPILLLSILYFPLNYLVDDSLMTLLFDFLRFVTMIFVVGCVLTYRVDNVTDELISEQQLDLKKSNVVAENPVPKPADNDNLNSNTIAKSAPAKEEGKVEEKATILSLKDSIDALEKNQFYLDADINIDWMANQLGTNRHYVSDYMNHILHMTFYEYVNSLRLQHAEDLIKSGVDKVSDLAYNSGFNSEHTFRRLFKEKYGCTPTQYLKAA